MASLIQIKRSQTQVTPGSLRVGELAYSMTDSGLKLYIGAGSPDSFQMADSVQSIGGRFYTKRLDVDSLGISEPGKYLLLGDSRNVNYLKLDSGDVNQLRISNNLVVPVGTDSQRPIPSALGQIRFNTTQTTFEGYDGVAWGSLGGVKDVDQDTFILAETNPGADNDDLQFFTKGVMRMQITDSGSVILPPDYIPDSQMSVVNKQYVDNVKAGSPLDSDWTDGAYMHFKDSNRVTDVLDGLNEALNNVRNNCFVRNFTFVAVPDRGGEGFTTTLNFTMDGQPNRYTIDWGDSSQTVATSDATPSHTYTNALMSPATVTVRAFNTNAVGTGSEAFRTNKDYIIIYTADPTADFELYRTAQGGSALSGNDVYVIEGQSLYLKNTSTNTQVQNKAGPALVQYNMEWADGSALDDIPSDSAPGGVIGTRLQHTWGAGTHTGTGRDNLLLTMDSHSTADPAVIPQTKTELLKVYDPNIGAPDGLGAKTISFVDNTGSSPIKLAANCPTGIPSGQVASAGDVILRTTKTGGFVESTTITSFAFGANSGVLSAQFNNAADGQVTMDGTDKTGTYVSLSHEQHTDFNLFDQNGDPTSFATSIYHPNLYFGFKASVRKSAAAIPLGVNNMSLKHSTTGETNKLEFVKDDLTLPPSMNNSGSLTEGNAGQFRYISGVPYYNSGGPSLTLSGSIISDFIGKTYKDTGQVLQVTSGTNHEGSSGSAIGNTQNYSYSAIDGASTFLSGSIPIADTGNGTTYNLGNVTVNINTGNVRTVEQLRLRAQNVNGFGNYVNIPEKIAVHTSNQSGISEIAIDVSNTLGEQYSDDAVRIFDLASEIINTPNYNSATNFYTNNIYTENSDPGVVGTKEATVRLGILKHDLTDYSTGFLPVGPNRSGDTGTQYFTMAWRRKATANFNINITSPSGVAAVHIAAPGTAIDNTSTANGWLDCSTQYNGSGVPGANIGNGGNGSNGCAYQGSDIISPNTALNGAYNMTLGTENLTNATNNVCLVRIALTSGQTVTALSIS